MFGANLSIFQKGLLLAGIPFLFQFLFVGFLLRAQSDAAEAERWSVHTKVVIAQAELTFRLVVQSLSRARGAVVSGDPNFVPGAGAFDAAILPEIEKLRQFVTDNPAQVERVGQYKATAAALLSWVGEERQWVAQGLRQRAVERVQSHQGEALMATLQAHLDAFLAEEARLDRRRAREMVQARRSGNWVLGASAVVGLALAAGMLWAFTSGIASRLEVLADNADRLAGRQPLHPPVGGADEIAEADAAFRAAAERLSEAAAAERRYRADLERRAAELARVNQELALKTQENETFVYSVSHDLRSPLVNLQGFGKELGYACEDLRQAAASEGVPPAARQRLAALIDGDIAESVRFIQTAVTRSGNIIDALLLLSRAGHVEYKMQAVDVGAVIARVVGALGATIRQRAAEVTVAPDLPSAWADPSAVEQVFANLIGNAVNYLDPGRPGRVEVGWSSDAGVGKGTEEETDPNGSAAGGVPTRDTGLGAAARAAPRLGHLLRPRQRDGRAGGLSGEGLRRLPAAARGRGAGGRNRAGAGPPGGRAARGEGLGRIRRRRWIDVLRPIFGAADPVDAGDPGWEASPVAPAEPP